MYNMYISKCFDYSFYDFYSWNRTTGIRMLSNGLSRNRAMPMHNKHSKHNIPNILYTTCAIHINMRVLSTRARDRQCVNWSVVTVGITDTGNFSCGKLTDTREYGSRWASFMHNREITISLLSFITLLYRFRRWRPWGHGAPHNANASPAIARYVFGEIGSQRKMRRRPHQQLG